MKKFIVIVFAALLAATAYAGPLDIPEGSRCAACGMKVNPQSGFAAQAITPEGKHLAFCDIGDMLSHYRSAPPADQEELYVQEAGTGRWLDALSASYEKSESYKTPMGWGIGAHEGGAPGAVGFKEALELVK